MTFFIPSLPCHNDEEKWLQIRLERDRLLAACDWTQVLDAPLTISEQTAWTMYRQELRDLPQAFSNPDEVVFPIPPA